MKTLLASAALLITFGLGGAALAAPGHGGNGKHRGNNDRGGYTYDNGYDGYETYEDRNVWGDRDDLTVYDVPDFDRQVRRGVTFRRIKRMMRKRMQTRIARKTHRIHARFGYNRVARRMIRRMERRERARFQQRLGVVRARFDRMHAQRYVEPAPRYTYETPSYDGYSYTYDSGYRNGRNRY